VCRDDVHGFGVRVEYYLGFSALQLTIDVGKFLLQRKLPLTIVSALAEHERLNDAAQRLG
jgi:hypothetical protein